MKDLFALDDLPLRGRGPAIDIEMLVRSCVPRLDDYPFPDDLDGLLALVAGEYRIVTNSGHSRVKQRYTMAHELVHFLRHLPRRGGLPLMCFASRANDPLEREANRLAAQILMPTVRVLEEAARGVATVEWMAHRFDVSRPAMEIRLKELGVSAPIDSRPATVLVASGIVGRPWSTIG